MRIMRLFALLAAFITLPAAAAIRGVVINGDGQPVAGATVTIFAPESIEAHRLRLVSTTPDRPALATATTDAKGNFTFDSPKGQPVVDLSIQANGFAPDALRVLADDDAGVIALSAAPMQRGTITANGKPVAGATVAWMGNGTDYLVKSDAQGHYSVPDPSKWAGRVIIVHPDYAVIDDSFLPRMTPKLDRALSAGVAVTGKVLSEDGKSAVAKAQVMVEDLPAAVTADNGAFTIAHAPANWQDLEARSGALAGSRARAGNGAIAIRLAKSATITGTVRDAKTQQPLAGAEVRLGPEMMMAMGRRQMRAFGGAGGSAIESTLTDAKGNYTITTAPGHYNLTGVYPGSAISQTAVSLTAGQTLNKALYSAQQARVSGTVADEDRRPVAGAHITAEILRRGGGPMMFMPGAPDASGYSGPDGHFVLRSVGPDADLRVGAVKKGLPPAQSATMKLAAGEQKSGVNITIARGVALSGRVIDGSGRPLSGVRIDTVESDNGGMRGGMVRRVVNMMARQRTDDLVTTASDGTFTVRVKPGMYDVIFKREGFSTKVLHGTSIDAAAKPVEVKLDPSVEITGRVVRNGAGIEGAMVNAMSEDGPATTTTASDGSFTLTDLNPGQVMLSVMKPDAFIQQIRPATAPASNLMIELPSGGRITGRVVDKATHSPVTAFQAGISFQRGAGGMMIALPPMLKDFTSDDGSFTLDNVPPGPTQLVVSAPGYTTARVPGLTVEDGKVLDNVEVDLDTGVHLSGRVTDTNGAPVSGVSVREAQNGGMRGFGMPGGGNATTDPNGEYSIDAVDPGDKTFTFSHQGYIGVDKSITLSGREARLDAQLSSGMTISGTVVTDAGAPVADASVNAMSASGGAFGGLSARTDSSGSFQMTGLAPGHYQFIARKDGVGQGEQRDVDVTTTAPRIVIPAGGTIMGHITGLTEAELQNTTVFANSQNGNATAAPDASGSYQINGAPTGSVHVMARTSSGIGPGGKSSGMVSVQVDAGSTATADIQFKSTTVVTGRVTRNGQPMSNVIVMFNPRGGPAASSSGTTDSNGAYSISGLDDGNYNVGVLDIDRSNAFSSTYEVHGSGNFDIAIKTVSLHGTVVDSSTGNPIAAAQIQLQNTQGGFMGMRMAQTDPSGAFTVDNLANGTYHVVVQKEGYGNLTRDLTVTDTPPDDQQFKLASSSGVTISVVDARDNRQIAASATRVVDASGQNVSSAGGMFFGGGGSPEPIKLTLAPGQYTVTIAAMGYATKVMTVTSPSNITVALTPGVTIQLHSTASTPVRARLVDAAGAIYRGFMLDPSPLTTTVNNVAPGTYTLQVLDNNGNVVKTVPVTITDGLTPINV